jgi:hypothetical protein
MAGSLRLTLASSLTKAASFTSDPVQCKLNRYRSLVLTLEIESAERETNETYDFYIVTGDGRAKWDLAHFAQIATTGAKRFTARLSRDLLPQNVTNAAPGVAANDPSILTTTAGGAHDVKTLTAGSVRQGPWGDRIGYELVVAGTVATGVKYSISLQAAE